MHGIAGKKFQSPFASPPSVGESSPLVNVIWGLVNFSFSYVLIFGVGDFVFGSTLAVLMVALGTTLNRGISYLSLNVGSKIIEVIM